jgi:2-keto-4-pentenoate hydratase/2-oxohepta-3-ene-1,7-dioic acid hydratase in catechol pathway
VRFANLAGRAVVVVGDRALDVERESAGRFSSDPQAAFDDWAAFAEWAGGLSVGGEAFEPSRLEAPVPRPRQIFAIGVNYAEHAAEAGYPADTMPVTFTKFPSCLAGPVTHVELPTATVDWEVELVVVIGATADRVSRENAWTHVAGLTVGQDLSERTAQLLGGKPQFSLAKSHRGFGPTGPWLVTLDEFDNPSDLAIGCSVSGEQMQASRTSQLVYDVPELIARLSSVCVLSPGDLIFSGTPAGVGNAREPRRFLAPGDTLSSTIEGIGSLEQTFHWSQDSAVR